MFEKNQLTDSLYQIIVAGIVLVVLLVQTKSFGRTIGTFNIEVSAPDAGNLVSRNTLGSVNIGDGWKCWAEGEGNTTTVLQDYKGSNWDFYKSIPYEPERSFLANPRFHTSIDVPIDANNVNLNYKMGEFCEECHTDSYTTTDGNGNLQTNYVTTCTQAHIQWQCDIKPEKMNVGVPSQVPCQFVSEKYGAKLPKAKLANLKRSPVSAKVTLTQKKEKFDIDLCKGKVENKVKIALRQGVGGHKGENDFRFEVRIGNEKPFIIKTEDGFLNHDIAYCGAEKDVKVKISPYEKDLLLNDYYTPIKADAFVFDSAEGEQVQSIEYKRSSYFGMTPRKHMITVGFSPVGVERSLGIHRPMLAEYEEAIH